MKVNDVIAFAAVSAVIAAVFYFAVEGIVQLCFRQHQPILFAPVEVVLAVASGYALTIKD
jgi:hypothetical protein